MNNDSRLIDSSTAITATIARRPNVNERRDEVPERVGREEGREEDRDGRRVHRVRGGRIAARRLHLADDEQRGGDENPDRNADRRLQPPGLDGVLQEEHGRHHQRDARERRGQLHADQTLPVERWGRPAGGGGGGGGGAGGRGTSGGDGGRGGVADAPGLVAAGA